MERVVSPEERLRRAEEIYYRRRVQGGVRVSTSSVNVGKGSKPFLGKKMIVQICICAVIYVFFWGIKGNDSVFGKSVIENTKMVLEYDINFQNLYNQCVDFFNSSVKMVDYQNGNEEVINNVNNDIDSDKDVDNKSDVNSNIEENKVEDVVGNETGENVESNNLESDESINIQNKEESIENIGIGGGSDDVIVGDAQNKSQMELDAEYVKDNCNFIIPVNGYITSGFGDREPTEIISAFHQGVDIGAVTGTKILASMEGNVVAASYAGDYGNHIKIQNGDVLTVYAHCSKLYVNVGDYINQGQEIGEVGATGKVTGPHLHFEIRKDNRYIDPQLILNFN